MGKTIVISQSNYLPWRGYFDLMRRADVFVLLDVVQFTKNDWRNRNLIKAPPGRQWLTIPVRHSIAEAIDETRISDTRWATKHVKTLRQNYQRAPAFEQASAWLFPLLESLCTEASLASVNAALLQEIARRLKIETQIVQSYELVPRDALVAAERNERLIALCAALGGERYLSGPAARAYLEEARFIKAGIDVAWMEYPTYAAYPQLHGDFDGGLSIVDLLLNVGDDSAQYLAGAGV